MTNLLTISFSNYSLILLILFLFYFLLLFVKAKSNIKIFVVIVSLVLMAFLFDPIRAYEVNGNYTDLYRYFNDLKYFNMYGWNVSNTLLLTDYSAILPVKIVLFIIAKININNLLPALSALIVYGLFAKVLNLIKEDNGLDDRYIYIAFFIFVCLLNFKAIITNIRMPMGFSILFYTLYKDLVRKESFLKSIFVYILLCFIHNAFLIFLLIRLLIFVIKKYGTKISIFIAVIYEFIFINIYSGKQIATNSSFINELIRKINFYTSEKILNSYYDVNIQYLDILKLFFIVYLLLVIYKRIKNSQNLKQMLSFSMISVAFTFGSLWSVHMLHRMSNFLIYLLIFYILQFYKLKNKKIERNKFYLVDIIVVVLIFVHLSYYFFSYQYRVLCF